MRACPFAVFIARLQPPHRAHIQCLERALEKAEQVVIVLGSDRTARNLRNPWTAHDREQMVRRCFDYETGQRLHFVAVRDQPYNDTHWMADVHQKVRVITGDADVALVGHVKDRTSFYLDFFPQWTFLDLGLMHDLNATDIREQFFEEGKVPPRSWKDRNWRHAVHDGVRDFMDEFRASDAFDALLDQWRYVTEYKKRWAGAPFPPTFVTTDAVVVKSGHVLLIRRGGNPGMGLLALPGGFVDQDRTLEDCMLRELKEETRIRIDIRDLRQHIRGSQVFAHPERSMRGRTITHAFHIKLPDGGVLPDVRADSDAKGAFWMPLGDLHLHEHEFFEDHLDIVEHFVTH